MTTVSAAEETKTETHPLRGSKLKRERIDAALTRDKELNAAGFSLQQQSTFSTIAVLRASVLTSIDSKHSRCELSQDRRGTIQRAPGSDIRRDLPTVVHGCPFHNLACIDTRIHRDRVARDRSGKAPANHIPVDGGLL